VHEPIEKQKLFKLLFTRIDKLVKGSIPASEALYGICEMLKTAVPAYDWVGFYVVDRESRRELVLGPYAGDPTEHVRIPFGKGICGRAAEAKETVIIQDVSKEDNYLSCSINVKSEIVVPIIKDGEIIGELDIDSHQAASFTRDDELFLAKVAEVAAGIL